MTPSYVILAFNLINEVDVPGTEARIAAYRAENAALIQLNIQRERMDAQELKEEEERDRHEREERMRELRREEEAERLDREKERKAIIDGLVRVFALGLRLVVCSDGIVAGIGQGRLCSPRHRQVAGRGGQAQRCTRLFISLTLCLALQATS